MNRLTIAIVPLALLIGVGIGYVLHRPASVSTIAPPGERKVLYWYDPMQPTRHFNEPGKSPYMDMPLKPKYADEAASTRTEGVSVSARTTQDLGIRTAPIEHGALAFAVAVVGTVAYDESALEVVQARTRGYLARVYVRKPLTAVRRGEPLAELVSPEWSGAEAEYLALRSASPSLRDAARQRLIVLGLPDASIRRLERTGRAQTSVTLVAPRDGVVAELDAREGQAVEPGMPLFRINGLDTVWLQADVPETQSAGLREGTPVSAAVSAFPGRTFAGRVSAILPQVDPTTRTLRLRIELTNSDRALIPGMFAQVKLEPSSAALQLLVPSEAVIRTGTRTVVIVADEDGRFRPVDVKTGAEGGGKTAILDGLDENDRVVVSGQFLIDSEANLRGSLTRMSAPPSEKTP
jgi:Cu(I)/Ag(I) efflux system membrane fusion protein